MSKMPQNAEKNGPIEHVTVVGGGTSGWLVALILNSFLNSNRDSPRVAITLIESPNIPTVGVGEATIQTIASLLQQLNLDEGEFFFRCNATFKLSVRFNNWWIGPDGQAKTFFHPFNVPPPLGGFSAAYHFLTFGDPALQDSIADAVVPNLTLIKAGKGPRPTDAPNYDKSLAAYSYHLDAGLFAGYLRDVAVARGVNHIKDDVVKVHLAEDGSVTALQLEEGGRHPVEFVFDCTGFKGLIINEALNEPFVPLNHRLLNDRAIPLQIPYRDPTAIEPCTRSSALGAGWVWRVPLFNRLGTGYVYSSAFRSDDEARREFIGHLREIGDLSESDPEPETRIIDMRVGHSRRFWVKNCVAIGLAAGFVEPLEATGIYMIEAAARTFISHLPNKNVSAKLADSYNRIVSGLYEDIVDFIQLHYVTSNLKEPYWKAAREAPLSDWLAEKLEVWKYRLPEATDTATRSLFKYWSYIYVLQPKGFFDGIEFPLQRLVRRDAWDTFRKDLLQLSQTVLPVVPSHHDLIVAMRSRGERASRDPRSRPAGAEAPKLILAR